MSWATGEGISGQRVVVRFLVPNETWMINALIGSMLGMMTPFNWDQVGAVTDAQAAAAFSDIFFGVRVQPNTVGSIWWFPNNLMQWINQDESQGPSQFLQADGSELSVVSYPELYAIVGNLYGGDMTVFNLPDLRGRTAIGTGTGSGLSARTLGANVGEEDHALLEAENSAHTHSYSTSEITGLAVGPGEFPVVIGPPTPFFTGFSGSGTPHNNMQPSAVLTAYIQAFP